MLLIYGSRLFGSVDRLSNGRFVATRFAHVWYIPLIPMGSWLVTSSDGSGWHGSRIPLSVRSVLMAYTRVMLSVIAIVAAVCAMGKLDDSFNHEAHVTALIAWLCVAAMAIGTNFVWRRASESRAAQLAATIADA